MIEVIRYASCMQFYAFLISFMGYHAYIFILSSVYSNLYHIFFFTYNWSHKLELLYTFMFLIYLFGIINYLFIRLTLIIVFVMLKLHDFLSLLKKYPYLKINMKASVFVFSYKQHILWMVTVWFYLSGVIFFGLFISQQYIIPQRNLLPEYD